MITLYKNINGKLRLVDFGTKPDVSLYIRLGYVVKVLKPAEVVQLRAQLKFTKLYKTMPMGMRKKAAELVRDNELSWEERLDLLKVEIFNSKARAERNITVVHRVDREWTITEQINGVVDDVKTVLSVIKSVFMPPTLCQLQLARY